MRLGWSSHAIAVEAGLAHRNHVWRIINGQKGKPTVWIQQATDQWVRDVYDRLSMTLPTTHFANRTRAHAEKMGWPPPLAWDDIDDPNERPQRDIAGIGNPEDRLDHAVVFRVVSEVTRPRKLTRAESAEVVRALLAKGMTANAIEDIWGIRPDRHMAEIRGAA